MQSFSPQHVSDPEQGQFKIFNNEDSTGMGPIQRDSDPLVTTSLESGSPRKGQRGAIYQPFEQRVTAEYQPCTSVFVPVFKRGYSTVSEGC